MANPNTAPREGKSTQQPSWDLVLYRLDEITGGQAIMNEKLDAMTATFVPRNELNEWRKISMEEHIAIRAELEEYKKEVASRFANYTWVIRTLFVAVAGVVVTAMAKLILK